MLIIFIRIGDFINEVLFYDIVVELICVSDIEGKFINFVVDFVLISFVIIIFRISGGEFGDEVIIV